MPGVQSGAIRQTVPVTVISAAGNSGSQVVPWGATQLAIVANVSAYTSGTITYEVQWSLDGVNFFSADPKDTFGNITAVKQVVKVVTAKAPYYRVTWTTGAYTHGVSDVPVTYAAPGTSAGYEQGAGALGVVSLAYIASTTLAATFVQGTTASYSAIKACLAGAGRMAIKLNVTANTWTTGQPEVLWSFDGVNLIHADPVDQWAALGAGASTTMKDVVVKAPFFAVAFTAGTPGSATFTADAIETAL